MTVATSTTDSTSRRIRSEQVRLLYAQAPLGASVSLLIAPLLVLVTWNAIAHGVLLAWLFLLELTVLLRLGLTAAFRRRTHLETEHLETETERWANRYTWACAASGSCWGGTVILLILSPSLIYETFITLVLGGVLMGGALTMIPAFSTYFTYVLPLVLPPVLWLLLQDDPLRETMGAMGVLYALLALGTAHRYHHTLVRSLRLSLENSGLASSFAETRQQAEQSSQLLAEQQVALRNSVEGMRELHEVIAKPRRYASDKIQAILAMGCQRFGLAIGILSHVEGERYEVMEVITPGGEIAKGDIFTLGDTYCRDTLRTQGVIGFERASGSARHTHPCYVKFKLEAYLGVPVRVSGQVYGTLNFSAPQPRPTPFTTVDHELIQLMAQWVGGALEQERMAAEAQQQQRLLAHASRLNTLGEMASGLVHEINQPVTAITLYAETCLAQLQSGLVAPATLQEALGKIVTQIARVSAIIQQMRHFAQQGKSQHTPVHIHNLINDIADFLNLEATRNSIRIRYDAPSNLPMVLADSLQIQQVILNLVRNAVDAIGDNDNLREISIRARLQDEMLEIAVQDTGHGIPAEIISQLAHPFFTTKADGLGLGLPISQSIVEMHGGRLWVTPNTGPGVTFHFSLPIMRTTRHDRTEVWANEA
ncbi:MAG: ATP-binding protein [Candidatus Competibacteraceae bacterium]